MSIFDFLVASLACWRIASLLSAEDGPGEILAKFRKRVGVRYDERSVPYGTNVFAKALLCTWCFSLWISWIPALLIKPANIHTFIIYWLSLSAATILIDELISKLQRN